MTSAFVRGLSALRLPSWYKCWMMGMANAAVFPVPVCALPSTSFLCRISGMAFSCTGVGVMYSSFRSACNTGSIISRSSNVICIMVWSAAGGMWWGKRSDKDNLFVETGVMLHTLPFLSTSYGLPIVLYKPVSAAHSHRDLQTGWEVKIWSDNRCIARIVFFLYIWKRFLSS